MNTWMKKLTALILIALLVVGSVNLTANPEGEADGGLTFSMTEASAKGKKVAPKKVKIEGSKYVAKGKKIKLKATVLPEGANQKVTWSSSNPAVAKVDSKGSVKGLKAGKVKITAASKDNPKKKKTFALQVVEQAVKKVKISGAAETMTVGTTLQLTAAQEPKKAAKSFTWSTSDANVATVSAKGLVTAVGEGTATITAAATDGSKKKASVTIQVIGIPEPTEVPTAAPTETPVPTEVPTVTPEPTATPEPTPTPEPTKDPKTISQNFTVGGATYHYDGETQKVSLSTIDDTPASGGFIVPAEVPVPVLGTITVSAVAKGALAGKTLNYIAVEGANTVVEDSTGTTYVFTPSTDQVASGDATVIRADEVKKQGEFLYQVDDTNATLLCPEDVTAVTGDMVVPAGVEGKPVTVVSEHALDGTSGVTSMSVPENTQVESGVDTVVTVTTRKIATGITIPEAAANLELEKGKTLQFTASVSPEDAENKGVTWSSSNTAAATVDQNGMVTAVAYSDQPVTITATAVDGVGVEAKVEIQVWNIPETIEITNTEESVDVGGTLTMTAVLSPDGIKPGVYPVEWSVSPGEKATINNDGLLTATAAGNATVTAAVTANGTVISTTKEIKVYAVPESVALTGEPKTIMTVGETQQLSWEISPDGANPSVSFSCDEEGVVTVSPDGVVTATDVGERTITITAGEQWATLIITVLPRATGLLVSGETTIYTDIDIGTTSTSLTATVVPEGAQLPANVVWSSGDANIATVDQTSGVVTAVAPGTVTITATAGDISGSIMITVSDEGSGDLPNPKLINDGQEYWWYRNLQENNTTMYSDFMSMSVPNNVRDDNDHATSWELVHVSGPDCFELAYNPYEGWSDSYFQASIIPQEGTMDAGKSVYTMQCTYQGVTYKGTATINIADAPDTFPTKLNLNAYETDSECKIIGKEVSINSGTLTLTSGENYAINGNPDGNFPNVSADDIYLNSSWCEGIDFMDGGWQGQPDSTKGIYEKNTQCCIATTPGTYQIEFWMNNTNTNYAVITKLTLVVTDEEGNIPNPKLDNDGQKYYWYRNLQENNTTMDNGFMRMWLPYDVRDDSDHATSWELVHVSGPDCFELAYNPYEGWSDSYFQASIIPQEGTMNVGKSVYTMQCTYQGVTYEGTATINIADAPDTFPTKFNVKVYETNSEGNDIMDEIQISNETLTLTSGKNYAMNGNLNGSFPDVAVDEVFLNISYYDGIDFPMDDSTWQGQTDSTRGIYQNNTQCCTATTPGIYQIELWTNYMNSNYAVITKLTLVVTDEEGNIPNPKLDNDGQEYWWYKNLQENNTTMYSDFMSMSVPYNVRDESDHATSWGLVHVSGPDCFELAYNPYEGWSDSYFQASIIPQKVTMNAGKSVYTMQCTYQGVTYEGTAIINITDAPDTFPTKINLQVYETNSESDAIGNEVQISNGMLTLTEGKNYLFIGNLEGSFPDVSADEVYLNYTYNSSYFGSFPLGIDTGWKGQLDHEKGIYQNNTRCCVATSHDINTITFWTNYRNTNYAVRNTLKMVVTDEKITLPLANADQEYYWYRNLQGKNTTLDTDFMRMMVPQPVRDDDDHDLTWQLILKSGQDYFRYKYNPNESWPDTYFEASIIPKVETMSVGDSVYTMNCNYKGVTYVGTATIHIMDVPSTFPTEFNIKVYETNFGGSILGDEVPINNGTLTLKSGNNYLFSGSLNGSFPNIPVNQVFLNITYNGGIAFSGNHLWQGQENSAIGIYENNSKWCTATTPGDYEITCWTIYPNSNYAVRTDLDLNVTE